MHNSYRKKYFASYKMLGLVILYFSIGFSFLLSAQDLVSKVDRNIMIADSLQLIYNDLEGASQLIEESLLEIQKARLPIDTLAAKLHFKLSYFYFHLGDYNKAFEQIEKAIILQQNFLGKEHAMLAHSLYQKGLIFMKKSQHYEAREIILKAIEIASKDNNKLADYYWSLGYLNYLLGDYQQAISYYSKSKNMVAENSLEYAKLLHLIGSAYKELGATEIAINYYNQSIKKNETLIQSFPDVLRYKLEFLAILKSIASFHLFQSNYPEAIKLYKEVLRRVAFFKNTDIKEGLIFTLANEVNNDLGYIYAEMKQFKTSKKHLDQALKGTLEFYKTPYHLDVATVYSSFGDLYANSSDFDNALFYYQKSIHSLVPEFQFQSNYSNPLIFNQPIQNKWELLDFLIYKIDIIQQKIDAEGKKEDRIYAFQTYQTIDTLISNIRQGFLMANSRYNLVRVAKPVYEQAIETTLELYELTQESKYFEQAYQFSAKNKAIVLLDGLQNEAAKTNAGIPEEFMAQEEQLKKKYYDLERKIYAQQQVDNDSLERIYYDSFFNVSQEHNYLVKKLENDFPAYHDLKYAFTKPLSITDLQKQLPDSALLIEYLLGEEQLFIFSISKDSYYYDTLTLPKGFRDACENYQLLMGKAKDFPKEQYLQSAHQLYEWLLKQPLEKVGASVKRLFIIPDDILIPLSFATFLSQKTQNWLDNRNPYLIKKYAINYAYSNQLLFDKNAAERVDLALKNFGGFGIEYNNPSVYQLNNENTDSLLLNRAIGNLPHADEEILNIYQILNGFSFLPLATLKSIPFLRPSTYINKEATKEQFMENAGDYRIIHLSLHGLVDNENPLNSSLIFSSNHPNQDPILRASELYSMNLNAEMVVLGACDTGIGKINKGEGIRSLARVFTYIGSPSLLASLWKASDNATKKIMVSFYKQLKEGKPKDIALQQAQIAFIQQEHPHYATPARWGHLAIIGDTHPIAVNNNRNNFYIFAIGIICLIFFLRNRVLSWVSINIVTKRSSSDR